MIRALEKILTKHLKRLLSNGFIGPYYASVGGATRHTVVRLFVCVCVIPSVTSVLRRTLKGKL